MLQKVRNDVDKYNISLNFSSLVQNYVLCSGKKKNILKSTHRFVLIVLIWAVLKVYRFIMFVPLKEMNNSPANVLLSYFLMIAMFVIWKCVVNSKVFPVKSSVCVFLLRLGFS